MTNSLASFNRTIVELEKKAVKWWPPELNKREATTSIIPILLKTQDKFISILKLCSEKPEHVFELLEASSFPANLFLKHLVVLADFGGEQIQRLNREFIKLFPSARFEFFWHEKAHVWLFKKLPLQGILNNTRLGIDGEGLTTDRKLDDLDKDLIMILLFGSNASDSNVSELLTKCEIGNLLGRPEDLEKYVKQRYIWVSRITAGAQSNALGQVAQHYLAEFLRNNLPKNLKVTPHGHIEGVTQNDGKTLINFDIVVSNGTKTVAVELSFQVTTNSVIERKSGQAKSRYDSIKNGGNYIAYVIDGAGNFQRRSAVSTICENSDCTVAFSDAEFRFLIAFIQEKLG